MDGWLDGSQGGSTYIPAGAARTSSASPTLDEQGLRYLQEGRGARQHDFLDGNKWFGEEKTHHSMLFRLILFFLCLCVELRLRSLLRLLHALLMRELFICAFRLCGCVVISSDLLFFFCWGDSGSAVSLQNDSRLRGEATEDY